MKKNLLVFAAIFTMWGCNNNPTWIEPDNYTITIDAHLPRDANGFYHLKLLRDRWQTVHRISGLILLNGKIQTRPQEINWESSHSWRFNPGDTVITIYRRNVDQNGRWVVIDTQTVVSPDTLIVPTINPTSYSNGNNGEINTMIGPVLSMLGDTMTVRCIWNSKWYNSETRTNVFKVILE